MKQSQTITTKRTSTLFLRIALSVVGVVIGLLCFLVLRAIYSGFASEYPQLGHLRWPLLTAIGLSLVPFYGAIAQAFQMLNLIDKNQAFSSKSVKTLATIKRCAYGFAAVYAAAMYIVFEIAQAEDAPGLILIIGSVFVGVPLTVGVFMAILQSLLQNALEIKSENELTV